MASPGGVKGYSDNKLNFMFQSWVLNLYFDCPPNMGIHCPDAAAKAKVEAAIKANHITWHAFPHNAELETMGNAMIEAGLAMTHALDRAFGQTNKTVLSQYEEERDVLVLPSVLIPCGARRITQSSSSLSHFF